MQNQNIDPEQALQLFHIIGCKRAIAIQWGAFELADEPPVLLKSLFEKYNINDEQFLVLKIGAHTELK